MPNRRRITSAGLMGLVLVSSLGFAVLRLLEPRALLVLGFLIVLILAFTLGLSAFVFGIFWLIEWSTRSDERPEQEWI